MEDKDKISRRKFLSYGGWMMAAGIAAEPLWGQWPVMGWFRAKPATEYLDLGVVDDLLKAKSAGGRGTIFTVRLSQRISEAAGMNYVFLRPSISGQPVMVLSPLCSFRSCPVAWNQTLQEFHCPCDNSVYAEDGRVLAGPAEAPLEQLPWTVRDHHLYVRLGPEVNLPRSSGVI
ncbi:MAG: Rieske 2Fe-2S domain-containing protein [Firmicutes bacterium]|jgi:hypothetical protein|nr:Rieske 2Fe-2S domain-containing protein [Bacillota bacterium]MCL5064889.1 Rieske 2Fe-2S domain-containing protein [Bacillota bacterium]